ncbi:MAG: carboxypeptidase regulatory-like domain-containing protein [Isosphaeraceae bacterium]
MAGTSPSAPNGREYSILRPRQERGPLTVCEVRDGLVVRGLMIVMRPADRFGRLPRGEPRSAIPLCRRTWAILALAGLAMLGAAGPVELVSFVQSASAETQAGAPLPEITPAQLAAKIRESMSRYHDKGSLRIIFTETQDTNFKYMMNQGKPAEQAPILVSFRGRARFESDGDRWRAEYDSMTTHSDSTRLSPDRWSAGYDGTQHYHWQVSRNQFILGESPLHTQQWAPRPLFWEKNETEGLVRDLENTQRTVAVSIAQRLVEGLNCYVVEGTGLVDPKWGSETVISPSQGYLPIARKWTLRGKTYSSHKLQGVREIVPGIWTPERIEDESITVRDDGTSRLASRRRIQVVEYQPRQVPPADRFALQIPYGVDVVNLPQGSSYYNDPWWPEIGAMLRQKFGWPKPDFSRLRSLGSSSKRNLDGQPAPPIRVAKWLSTKPMDLASLRGKVVLVEFGSIHDHYGPRYAPALRELYSVYHPAGLEILSIHAPAEDADEIRRFAQDYRLPYPVVMDEGNLGSPGTTAEAFGIRGRICAFLIDHEGKIHSAGKPTFKGGRVIETVVALLQKSGARDVKTVSLETPRLPDEALQEAAKLWSSKAGEALAANPTGKIAGWIVDDQKRAVPGAQVQASLQFTMLSSANPGGYFNHTYRGVAPPLSTMTATDGRFAISGLCKGAYVLRINAPARAWSERKVFIGPDIDSALLEVVLDQGDSIAGQVRDPQGNPIAGATVTPTGRQHYEGDDLRYTAHGGGPEGVKTDDAGRFRFEGLQEGRYIIEVKAAGFKDRELEPIRAGDEKVVVTLERSP